MSGLWLCIALPNLPLDALGPIAGDPEQTVVYAQHGSRRWIVGTSHPRMVAGEALGSVQARFPDVRPRARDLVAEAAALQTVGCLAYALGDRITLIDDAPRGLYDRPFQAVSVDVGPSLNLFGGVDAMLDRARRLLESLPYRCSLGLAPTPEAAAVVARAELEPIIRPGGLRARLAALPLHSLRWPFAIETLLAGSGHDTLDDVLRHDAASLAARLGREFPSVIQRLLGTLPDPRPWFTPPARYRRRLDLDAEIEDWQALLFPLRRLFEEFEVYLRARQVAVTQLAVTLARRRSEGETFVLRTTAPTQQAVVFFRLLRERWNTQGPTAPANELRLRADRFVDLQSPQTQLFDDGQAEGEAWNGLVDRVRARLGDGALWRPGLVADHRPERTWSREGSLRATEPLPARPLWLLRTPRRYAVDSNAARTGAERISGGWWDGTPVARDYHWAKGANGEALWVYRDHADERWYVHGVDG